MTAIDDKFNEIASAMAAPGADVKQASTWNQLVENARSMAEQAGVGWESEPEPKGWKEKFFEAMGDSGIAMSGAPILPRYLREQFRQDVKKEVIESFEKGPQAKASVLKV